MKFYRLLKCRPTHNSEQIFLDTVRLQQITQDSGKIMDEHVNFKYYNAGYILWEFYPTPPMHTLTELQDTTFC